MKEAAGRTVRSLISPALPFEGSPADHAAHLGSLFLEDQPTERRRALGQFLTPTPVARFMARLARPGKQMLRILDPGAGSGVLACALLEELPEGSGAVHVDAYELDPGLARACRASLEHARRWLSSRGRRLTFAIHEVDFVTENASCLSASLFDSVPFTAYDLAVLNPPYFKLQKVDPRARAAAEIVHGQPNIYALFMAITAALLHEKGVMVSITPRSFTTGDYFRRFREYLFSKVTPEAVHLFHSRQDAFAKEEVLQENVIIRARKAPSHAKTVTVSTSCGISDLAGRTSRKVPLESVVDRASRDLVFHIPVDRRDDDVVDFVRAWPSTLASLGLAVSTGPVVSFRATRNLAYEDGGEETVPLLHLQHVQPMAVRWPIEDLSKPQYFRVDDFSRKLLVPSENCVVLRRFSAKEEKRRLVAAPVFGRELSRRGLALENHLNYVYRPRGTMTRAEAVGVAAVLGSSLLDRYFRVSNGNTQVNATELRALPLPSLSTIRALGEQLRETHAEDVDEVVLAALEVPSRLTGEAPARG